MNTTMAPDQRGEAEKIYKQEWDASSQIRDEFGSNYQDYQAFRDAQTKGLVKSKPRRFSLPTLEEHIKLSWDCKYDVRQRFENFEAYRSRRFFDEVLGADQ